MNDSQQTIDRDAGDGDVDQPGVVQIGGFTRRPDPRGVRKPAKGVRRLYRSRTSKTHVDIKRSDIVDLPLGDVELARGEVALWIRADADFTVTFGPKEPRFLGRPGWPRR
jgi:hypothetical protein